MVEEKVRDTEMPAKKKKREKEFRRVRTASPMLVITSYIMKTRVGSQNMIADKLKIDNVDKYIKEKQAEGYKNISYMHVLIAAYIRTVSQRPALNRFIRGQRIYTRRNVEISLSIKKQMNLESPDTVVKVILPPDATAVDVYEKLNQVVTDYRDNPGGDFDNTAKVLSYIPGLVLKFSIWFLNLLDYFGLLPSFLTGVSPFHCSFFITSMGSLGIPAIYHHLYDFGTCPVFCSFGTKKREYSLSDDGTVHKDKYIDVTFVLDERICDGYYYASSLKMIKSLIKNPWQLDVPPEQIVSDIP